MSALYRKWRPQTFGDLVGQDAIRDTLVYALTHDGPRHAYLFSGARGTGKTTTARLVAKHINCLADMAKRPCNQCGVCVAITDGRNLDVVELDGASNRGIDEIRALRETVKYPPTSARFKVFIIDEVHMLTREAFNALLKTLEEPPSHAVFILATTEPHKVPSTILSRAQRFDFRLASPEELAEFVARVAAAEGVTLDDEAAELVAALADGSYRDGLTLLDRLVGLGQPAISPQDVEAALGLASRQKIEALLDAILHKDSVRAFAAFDAIVAAGADMRAASEGLLRSAHRRLEHALKSGQPVEELAAWLDVWSEAIVRSKATPVARVPLDVAIAKWTGSAQSLPSVEGNKTSNTQAETTPRQSGQPAVSQKPPHPKSADPETPVMETVSVPVVAELPHHVSDDEWRATLASVKSESPSLLASLAHARVVAIHDGVATIAVPYKMHADKLNGVKNRAIVESALTQSLGVPVRVTTEVNKAAAMPDDVVDVAEVFELEI